MLKRVRELFGLHEATPPAPIRRPLYIERDSDGERFYRKPNGMYESKTGFIVLVLSSSIISGHTRGYKLSKEEAPDFHAPPPAPVHPHRFGFTQRFSSEK